MGKTHNAKFRKKHLEIIISKLLPHPKPKLMWETYTLDAGSAAEIAYLAGYVNDDLYKKKVIDLGCGTGILAISAALLGAKFVVGVDIDKDVVKVAEENAKNTKVKVEFVTGDLESITGNFDTAIMNPPFGSWNRGADVVFLKKAIELSNVTYSLHKSDEENKEFLCRKIQSFQGKTDQIYEINVTIPRIFNFHQKEKYIVKANLFRILKET